VAVAAGFSSAEDFCAELYATANPRTDLQIGGCLILDSCFVFPAYPF